MIRSASPRVVTGGIKVCEICPLLRKLLLKLKQYSSQFCSLVP
jgi:hypothetical protein